MAGANPIDNFVVSGALPKLNPFPHIPGAESTGIVEKIGSHVNVIIMVVLTSRKETE